MASIIQQSVNQLATMIREKQVSVLEVVSAYIQQIEQINPQLNAVVQFQPEHALSEAKRLDALLAKGKVLGPLHGVPFTLKDIYNTKGDKVTAGCLGLKENVADDDATLVKRLKAAGGILLGKTNTPELEMGADTDNLVYGCTHNPYDLTRSPGGSSGGSAAIVSACGSAFDIGADMGGSLRVPAHYCGLATVRTTSHRVPSSGFYAGLRTGIGGLFSTEGPLCRAVEDLPLILSLIQGADGIDSHTIDLPLGDWKKVSIPNLKVAYFDDNGIAAPSQATRTMIASVAKQLSELGAEVKADTPLNCHEGYQHFQLIAGANLTQAVRSGLAAMQVTETSEIVEKILAHLEPFACDLNEYMARWDAWERYCSGVLGFFEDYDALICPVTPTDALPHETLMWEPEFVPYASYTWTISATRLPVVVVRAGTSENGLPLGIQIVTKPCNEALGFAIAKQIEDAFGGWKAPTIMGV